MKTLTVAIPDDAAAKLARLAQREFRRPRDQASLLLAEAIERRARGNERPARVAKP